LTNVESSVSSARPTNLTVSVAICAYTEDRWEVLLRAVEAALVQLRDGDELILVADHAPELFAALSERFPDVRVLSNAYMQGLSGARNTAVLASSCDVVVFLDDDAVPTDGWLDALLVLYADPRIAGVGGIVDPVWPAESPAWLPPEFLWVVGCSYVGLPEAVGPIRNPIGANMSFRREVFGNVGLFSESLGRVGTLPLGCEETELGIRVGIHYGAGAILHQPASRVDHYMTAGRADVRYFYRRCWSEGRSKAAVSRLAGRSNGLSSERRYVTRTLPWAVVRNLLTAVHGDRNALARALNVAVGTLVTAAGYACYRRAFSAARLRILSTS
jgi:glycosyltransferase involved in cell wall biosynthesis